MLQGMHTRDTDEAFPHGLLLVHKLLIYVEEMVSWSFGRLPTECGKVQTTWARVNRRQQGVALHTLAAV